MGTVRPKLRSMASPADAEEMRKLPSPWSIVWTDKACYPMLLAPLMFFLFALAVKLTGTWPGSHGRPDRPVDPEVANLALACTGGLMVLLWSLVALRIARIRSLFDSGQEVEATIRKVKRFRGGWTLELEYEHAGTTYRVRSSFQNSSRTPGFTAGDRVSLLVDRMNPKRAVLTALYANDGDTKPAASRAAVEQPSAALPKSKTLGLQLSSGRSRPSGRDER